MSVKDPQQNLHRWWGYLEIDPGTVIDQPVDGTLKAKDECIFVKTSRDAHFVTYGTYVSKVRVLSQEGDKDEAIGNITNPSQEKDKIRADMSDIPDLPIVEILEIDDDLTPALIKKLNERTGELFNDDPWLTEEENKRSIGKADIVLGRQMESLPKGAMV